MSPVNEQVDQLFAAWDTPETPGCVLAVIQDGDFIYTRAYGMADLERQTPLTPDSVFDLGSTGKQFTAMLIALLDQQGCLSLDAPIQKYLPELPPYSQAITIRHLIHHTSGLRDYTTLMYLANKHFENFYFADEMLDLIARQQGVNFQPGAEHLYCNTGYLLLGVIASRATGKAYTDLIREYILDPLGMKNTGFNDSFKRVVRNRALGYSPNEDGGYWTDISFCGGYGDGALISTVGDLLLWDRNFYHNRLGDGQPELITQILTPAALKNGEALDYAFGLMVRDYKGLRLVSHGGAWAGYRAEMIRFPDQKFSVICLANLTSVNPSSLALQVADLYLADHLTEAKQPPVLDADALDRSTPDISRFVGVYRSQNGGSLARLSRDPAGVTLEMMGYTFPMEPAGANRLRSTGSLVDIDLVLRQEDAITVAIQSPNPVLYRRLSENAPASLQPQDYVGAYYSHELEITYRVLLDGDQLFVKRGYAPQEVLTPAIHDLYSSGFLIFEFFRDADGQIQGFDLFADRVIHIRFDRHVSTVKGNFSE